MALAAIRGAVGFLTSLPVGRSAADWEAFVARPGVIPAVGYVAGVIAALPFLLPLPAPLVGFLYVLAVYLATGINHVDGLLDVADGVATHGDPAEARAAMKDSSIGVGAVLTVGLVLLGLFGLGQALAARTGLVLGLVIAAEVAAKLAMATVIALGEANHEGLGEAVTAGAGRRTLLLAGAFSLPALVFTWPHPAAALAVAVGVASGYVVTRWARVRLGGINGDVIGATNELARLAALAMGVITWTLW